MTHTLESLHIFLESNYKEEKLAEKVRESIEFFVRHRNFNSLYTT